MDRGIIRSEPSDKCALSSFYLFPVPVETNRCRCTPSSFYWWISFVCVPQPTYSLYLTGSAQGQTAADGVYGDSLEVCPSGSEASEKPG